MAKLNVPQIIEREAKAQARKDEWRSIYEDCYEFALPQRNLYSGYYALHIFFNHHEPHDLCCSKIRAA